MADETMTGADALVATLADNGVDACFANPGTSEMHLVTALDRETRIKSVLCLFEGVATGAADGYARATVARIDRKRATPSPPRVARPAPTDRHACMHRAPH